MAQLVLEDNVGQSIDAGGEPRPGGGGRWFWLFAGLHVAVWSLLPALTQPNAPLDVVEMLFFGRQWQLGYFKHPPLASWMAEAAYQLAGRHVWGVYLAAQLAVGACLWAVWRLGRELLPPRGALLAALLLDACYYYNFSSTEFNNNVAMFPFWTLAILFGYWALTDGRHRWWIATGVALGMGMLAKYTTALLAVAMLLFLLAHPAARRWWRRPGPYLTLAVALLIFQPHMTWAAAQGFPAIDFALARTQGAGRLADHFLNPLSFAGAQMLALLPMVAVLAALFGPRWPRLRGLSPAEAFRRDFLAAMVLGPLALCLALSAARGLAFTPAYGSQLWPYAGLLALCVFRTPEDRRNWRNAWIILAAVASLLAATAATHNLAAPYLRREGSRIHFPGRALAERVDQIWRSRYRQPLPTVCGEWWLAGNAALYGPNRPAVYGGSDPDFPNVDPRYSAWLSDAAIRRTGAVLLWNARRFEGRVPSVLRRRFPGLKAVDTLELAWDTPAPLAPVRVGVGLVPPGDYSPGAR